MPDDSPESSVDQQIRQLSSQIADQYSLLIAVGDLRTQLKAQIAAADSREKYEALHADLEANSEECERIGVYIRQLAAKIEAIKDSQPSPSTGSTQPESRSLNPNLREIESLRRELVDIATRQIEAVKEWNTNPIESQREEFSRRYRELHRQYHETLVRLRELEQ